MSASSFLASRIWAFVAAAVAVAGAAAVAALEAGTQGGAAASALARRALPDVAPHGQHGEPDDNNKDYDRRSVHLTIAPRWAEDHPKAPEVDDDRGGRPESEPAAREQDAELVD